jgi:hypothetical protein
VGSTAFSAESSVLSIGLVQPVHRLDSCQTKFPLQQPLTGSLVFSSALVRTVLSCLNGVHRGELLPARIGPTGLHEIR